MRVVVVALSAMVLAGCATTPADEVAIVKANIPPDYKALIVDRVKHAFYDPYSIRSAGIALPHSWLRAAVVCVEANSKNRMGGYTGIRTSAFLFAAGKLSPDDFEGDAIFCPGNLKYDPFPELENIR